MEKISKSQFKLSTARCNSFMSMESLKFQPITWLLWLLQKLKSCLKNHFLGPVPLTGWKM